MGFWALAAWGAAGAFIYAANALVLELWNDSATRRSQGKAVSKFLVAVTTGAIGAAGATTMVSQILKAGLVVGSVNIRAEPDAVAVALTIGWSSNYLWPRLLRKLGKRVEGWGEKEP